MEGVSRNGMGERVAVVLFNLGGPDGRETVRPFLYNFFRDKNIIPLPTPLRQTVAALIAFRRTKREAGSSYALLGWTSPLLPNTNAQGVALEQVLNAAGQGTFRTFVCMRYWHPLADDVARQVKAWAPDRVVLLPLYPQYSTTTTRSSFQSWAQAAKKAGLAAPVSAVCCYPFNDGFVAASAGRIRAAWQVVAKEAGARGLKAPRLLFSAHGLPEKVIAGGDPYQWQCEESAKAIVKALGIPDLDWMICYQSKVGPLDWIGPSTAAALEKAAVDKVPVVIYPHAFVSEHVETLVEIDIEYRHLAEKAGVPIFARVETVGTDAAFIEGLKKIVLARAGGTGIAPEGGQRLCPGDKAQCCLNDGQIGL